jgi:nicotinamidase/pyrazinamidase
MFERRQILTGFGTFLGTAAMATILSKAALAASIKPDNASALLVIDVQNCFLPGGSLAVKDGDQVVPVINRIAKSFSNVVLTQDWHTASHVSFATTHSGKKPFETIDLPYGKQVLWPDHCVQGTEGAALSKDLSIAHAGPTPALSSARAPTKRSTAIRPSPKPMARPRPGLPPI